MEMCSPVILVQGRVDGEAVHKVWVGQVDAAIADKVCVVLLQCLDPRLPGVAASCDEGALVCMPEDLQNSHSSGDRLFSNKQLTLQLQGIHQRVISCQQFWSTNFCLQASRYIQLHPMLRNARHGQFQQHTLTHACVHPQEGQ